MVVRFQRSKVRARFRGRSVAESVGLGLLATLLVGCNWPQVGFGPGNTRFNSLESTLTPDNVATLSEQWSMPGGSFSEPILSDGRVYTTVWPGWSGSAHPEVTVEARDLASGALLWERSLAPEGVASAGATPVVFANGALWVGYAWYGTPSSCPSASGLLRLDPATGAVLTSEPGDEIVSPVVQAGSFVAYTSYAHDVACTGGSHQLVVRDAGTLGTIWRHSFPVTPAGTPTISDGLAFVVAGHDLYAFELDGCGSAMCDPIWVRSMGEGALLGRPVAGPDGQVFVIHQIGDPSGKGWSIENVFALDSATGSTLWQTAIPDVESVFVEFAATDATLYVASTWSPSATDSGSLDAFPASGCGQAVCSPASSVPLDRAHSGPPTIAGGVVYLPVGGRFPDFPNDIVAIDADGCGAASCDELTRLEFPYTVSQLTVAGGRLVVVPGTGWLDSTLSMYAPIG